jgi:hypothetical protein
MDERAVAIRNHLLKGVPGREISYQYAGVGGLHKFRIEGEPTHWLYVSYELESDSEPVTLVNFLNSYNVMETLNSATKSKWLFMTREELREVDENFAK